MEKKFVGQIILNGVEHGIKAREVNYSDYTQVAQARRTVVQNNNKMDKGISR